MGHGCRAGCVHRERAQAVPGGRIGGTALSALPGTGRPDRLAGMQVPVLMYHSISAAATRRFSRFAVDPAEFAEQMDYLEDVGYRPVTAAELVGAITGGPLPPRPVVLTFDDAYRSE